mmetsp:Transcript_23134/g.34161  ORF Transcript_23134/g.34161 Transcript_23134/m.34161 type:complete len:893 (-) Transcript_23134:388-3066(-)
MAEVSIGETVSLGEPSGPQASFNVWNNLLYPLRDLQTGETISIDDPNAASGESFNVWDNILPASKTASGTLHKASDVEVGAVLSGLWFNMIIFVVVICAYELVSRVFPSVYRRNRNSEIVLPKTPLPLAWVPAILRVSTSQVRKICGMDAYFFLRYIRICFQVTAITGFYGILILCPLYATGGNGAVGWYHLSMANLVSKSWRLWFPTGFMVLMTLYVCFLLNEEYKHYVNCRMEFLTKGDSHVHPQQRYTLMVEEIPHELRNDESLRQYFEQLFPNRVHSTCIVLNLPQLTELCARRERVVQRLEKCKVIAEVTGRRPFHKVGVHKYMDVARRVNLYEDDPRLPNSGERTDSINYYTKYLDVLNQKILEIQKEKMMLANRGEFIQSRKASEWISHSLGITQSFVDDEDMGGSSGEGMNFTRGLYYIVRKLGVDFVFGGLSNLNRPLDSVVDTVSGRTDTSNAFITFTDLVTVTCAVRAPLSHEAGVLSVQVAPDSRDIEWKNAHIDKGWSSGREGAANIFLGLGAILWSVPVTFVQALANLESLSKIPGLSGLTRLLTGDSAAFLNGYLPVLALIALIASLPPLFSWIGSTFERRKSKSDIQHSTIKRFFYYQLANIYITVTAGSILDTLAEILDHPSNVFALLGTSVPAVVGYFIMFILTKTFAALPFILLRVPSLLHRVGSFFCCRDAFKTARDTEKEKQSEKIDLGREYPNQLLVIVIMFTYATISPLILPAAAFYFAAAYVVYKKQLLFVYSSTYESGGTFFPTACNRTLVGLVAAQCTLIGYTVLRLGFYQPLVLFPLPFYTYRMMQTFRRLYEEPGQYLSLERAIDLDKQATKSDQLGDKPSHLFSENIYRQPNLRQEIVEPMSFSRSEDVDGDSSTESTGMKAV